MSPGARSSTTVESNHSSPRLIPPPQIYSVRDPAPRKSPSEKPERLAQSSSSQELVDPFLAQYIKSNSNNHHELYFRALNKQVRVKSFEYEKYLKHRKSEVLEVKDLRHDERKSRTSPLRKEWAQAHDTEVEVESTATVLDDPIAEQAQAARRRRRQTGSDPSQPGPKKMHPELIQKTLSSHFHECSSSDLINLISRMIQSLINLNDRNVPDSISHPSSVNEMDAQTKKKLLTRYHSRTPPAISIHTYLTRLTRFNNFSQTTLLTTIYYIDLLSHNFQPYFTLNSWTVHRFLLVATMLAQKSLEDFFYTNDHYAKVGGVALTELNCLELDFLNRVDWKVVPAKQILPTESSIKYSKEVLDLYFWQLVNLMGKNALEQNSIVYRFAPSKPDSMASNL